MIRTSWVMVRGTCTTCQRVYDGQGMVEKRFDGSGTVRITFPHLHAACLGCHKTVTTIYVTQEEHDRLVSYYLAQRYTVEVKNRGLDTVLLCGGHAFSTVHERTPS